LFEIRHLAVGKEPPEIEGEDQNGKEFKLSDYRGKVVLLDFWSQF
jgi:peroxiredoxin